MLKYFTKVLIIIGIIASSSLYAQTSDETAIRKDLQSRWASVNYQKSSKQRRKIFKKLVKDADKEVIKNPESVEILIWSGIINSSYAGVASTFSAMGYAKQAKKYFEKAISIDGSTLAGSAYTSLGTLYFKVPGGWIGFGDKKKAKKFLNEGLKINPDGIDSNYFYADFLNEEKQYKEAKIFLLKAQQAPVRPDRQKADKGRQEDIIKLLAEIESELD